MKNFAKILFLVLFAVIANTSRSLAAPVKGKDTDTSASLKSNIAIFKLITSPAPVPAAGKSLKKAGSVARTSNSHTVVPVKPVPEG
jgi:hypothetical protein